MADDPQTAKETVGALEELATQQNSVRVRDVLDRFGQRSFGPAMMLPALIEVSPVGSIPGVPTLLATFIGLVATQLVMGADHVWVPGFLEQRSLRSGTLMKGAHNLEGIAETLDRWFKGRLKQFTAAVWQRLAGLAVILLCLTVPFLEVLPFASTVPMLTIAAIALALTVRDGLLMLMATILSAAALGGAIVWFATGTATGLPF